MSTVSDFAKGELAELKKARADHVERIDDLNARIEFIDAKIATLQQMIEKPAPPPEAAPPSAVAE